jgi:Bacterial pre-peptidase C-terminal domain.
MHQIRRWVSVILIVLLALPLAVFGQAQWAEGGSIELGQTVSGQLTADDQAIAYMLEVEADTTVIITLRSNDFDAYLSLRDADGVEIAFDDDSAGSLNSRIGPLTFETAGTYAIVATSYGYRGGRPGGTGQFDLTVTEAQQRRIEYGQTFEGELTSNELEAFFAFTGAEGDSVVITLMSGDFDAYLILLGPGGLNCGATMTAQAI